MGWENPGGRGTDRYRFRHGRGVPSRPDVRRSALWKQETGREYLVNLLPVPARDTVVVLRRYDGDLRRNKRHYGEGVGPPRDLQGLVRTNLIGTSVPDCELDRP